MTAARASRHPGHDRLTLVFADVLPGYEVRYVREITHGASDKRQHIAGRAYLQITLSYAGSAKDPKTYRTKLKTGPGAPIATGFPAMQAYVMNDDYHGSASFTLGLNYKQDFRVTVDGSTLHLDVRHP